MEDDNHDNNDATQSTTEESAPDFTEFLSKLSVDEKKILLNQLSSSVKLDEAQKKRTKRGFKLKIRNIFSKESTKTFLKKKEGKLKTFFNKRILHKKVDNKNKPEIHEPGEKEEK